MTKDPIPDPRIKVGSVVQLNEKASYPCYVGMFLIVTEVKSWGVQGFVAAIYDVDQPCGRVFLRPKWEAVEFIGTAVLMPARDEVES